MKLSHVSTILLSLAVTSAFAEIDIMKSMITSQDHIQHLEKTLADVKSQTTVTAEFPAFIPKTEKTLYANNDATSKQNGFNYMINIDSTSDCNGAKYCNVGRVSAQSNTKIEMMRDRNKKIITVPVDLADGTKAYFTKGHAMGDYFPDNIQWMDNKVVYMISWEVESKSDEITRLAFITMANSAKHPGSG